MPDLDPVTGNNPSTLTVAQLAERLAMERAMREQEYIALREALEALKELFMSINTADARALNLQAAEYERRLEALNHAHQQAVEAQARTVPRELFDQYVKESAAREAALVAAQSEKSITAINALNDRVDEVQTWRSGLEGRMIGISIAIGIVVIVINIALRFIPVAGS